MAVDFLVKYLGRGKMFVFKYLEALMNGNRKLTCGSFMLLNVLPNPPCTIYIKQILREKFRERKMMKQTPGWMITTGPLPTFFSLAKTTFLLNLRTAKCEVSLNTEMQKVHKHWQNLALKIKSTTISTKYVQ